MNSRLYEETVPVFIRSLTILVKIINISNRYATGKKFDPSIILAARLAPDMYNFTQQVQYAYFTALEAAVNLSGRSMPKNFAYDEKTLKDLKDSLKRAIAFLRKIKPAEFEGIEKKKVETFLSPGRPYGAAKYVSQLALPNFFFHVTTAYAIARHLGVPLGKDDYLGLR